MASKTAKSQRQQQARTCLCSPTTHPGSFRCSLHRNCHRSTVKVSSSRKWDLALIAKANSFKAFLLQIIKPSSHDLQRRRNFQPRPSRFSLLNANRDHRVTVS